jgi:transposase
MPETATMKPIDPKKEKPERLARTGSLNAKSQNVSDDLFMQHEFFDARDLMQVKYEMVRRVQVDNWSVSDAAKSFGFSRVAFYQIQKAIDEGGLSGIVPKKRGPKSAYRLTEGVLRFMENKLLENDQLKAARLAELIEEKFGFRLHVRTIEKALQHRKKNHKNSD